MRKGELREMVPLEVEGKQRLVFQAPSRGPLASAALSRRSRAAPGSCTARSPRTGRSAARSTACARACWSPPQARVHASASLGHAKITRAGPKHRRLGLARSGSGLPQPLGLIARVRHHADALCVGLRRA